MQNKLFLLATVMLVALASCKAPSTDHAVNVKSFSFKTSDAAPDIKGIVFTVDTINNVIYNVDSVAYTSDLTKVVPVVACYSTPKEIRINDAAWNQTDSINVSAPFKLSVVGTKKVRDFTVTVNKHTVDQDKIGWVSLVKSGIDEQFTSAKAVGFDNSFVLIGNISGGKQIIYTSDNAESWLGTDPFDAVIDIKTVCVPENPATADSIYALSIDKKNLVFINKDLEMLQTLLPDGYDSFIDVIGDLNDGTMLILAHKGSDVVMLGFKDGAFADVTGLTLPNDFPVNGGFGRCMVHLDYPFISDASALYVFGGNGVNPKVANVFSTDNGWYWTSVIKSPAYCFTGLSNTSAAWYDKRLFLYGGKSAGAELYPAYVSFDCGFSWISADESERLPITSELAYDINVVVDDFDEYIYVLGGMKTDDTFSFQCFKGRAVKKDFIRK